MNETDLLKSAMLPVKDVELKHDLWPAMLRRIDQETVRVPWFDWALIAAAMSWIAINPQIALTILYHL